MRPLLYMKPLEVEFQCIRKRQRKGVQQKVTILVTKELNISFKFLYNKIIRIIH